MLPPTFTVVVNEAVPVVLRNALALLTMIFPFTFTVALVFERRTWTAAPPELETVRLWLIVLPLNFISLFPDWVAQFQVKS